MSGRATNEGDDGISAAVTAIWMRHRATSLARLAALEEAVAALSEHRLSEESRRAAESEAHGLAGSAGTFGFERASEAARELECILAGTDPVPAELILAAVDQVAAIRADLHRAGGEEPGLWF